MKKKVGSVVALAALVLGSYYGTGLVTERTLKKNMNRINQSSGLSVEMTSYHRGLFTSKAQLTWQLQTPERLIKNPDGKSTVEPSKTITIDMPIAIYHGPVIFAADGVHFGLGYASSQLTLPEDYKAKFAEYFSSESIIPTLDLSLSVSYLDETRVHVNMPAFRLISNQDKSQFEWLGMTSDHSISPTMSHLQGSLTINGIRATKENRIVVLDKVKLAYDLNQSLAGLYLGKMSMEIPSFVGTQEGHPRFEVVAFQATSSSEVVDGLFGSSFQTSVEKVLFHDKTYGPGQLTLAIKSLDAAVLADLNERANQMQQGTEAERQQAMLTLLPELPKLLAQGAMIELSELHVVMPDGTVDGSLRVMLPKGDAGNPFQLLQKTEGESKIKVPVTLLKNLLVHSEKQRLMLESKARGQQVSTQQETPVLAAQTPVLPSAEPAAMPLQPQEPSEAIVVPELVSVPVPSPDLEQLAVVEADKKIAALLKAGALVEEGGDYVVGVKLTAGRFSVNGQPFNSGMLQF